MTQRAMFVLLFFAMIGWGSSWVNVKVISTYINEFEMVFFRFSITILTMIPIMMLLKTSFRIDLKSFSLACIASIVLIIYMKYFFLGAKFGTASLGGAMVTTLIPKKIPPAIPTTQSSNVYAQPKLAKTPYKENKNIAYGIKSAFV